MDGAGIAAVIASVGTLISSGVGAYVLLARREIRDVRRDVRQVHTIVNQQRTDAANYTAVLIAALREKGIDVPDDESLDN